MSAGLFKRKEVWVPTIWGWMTLAALATLLVVGFLTGTVPFLSTHRPHHQGILVVEGWLPDYALEEAYRTFTAHPYHTLVLTGVPIEEGLHITRATNYAQLAATTLQGLGVPADQMVAVNCPAVPRNRTYSTALKFREWLDTQPRSSPVDVLTLGVHARRTWLCYRMVLGETSEPGIIAARDRRYERAWWKTSSGFRTVTAEVIAYVYAKLFFHPTHEAGPQ